MAVACSRPGSYEEFVRAEDAVGGVYEFALPFQGTTSNTTSVVTTYDISFYTSPLDDPLQLAVTWHYSPDEVLQVSQKTGHLQQKPHKNAAGPPSKRDTCSTYNSNSILLTEAVWFPAGVNSALYRSGIKVPTEATITIRVKPLNPPQTFRGLGIICKQNDGTR